MLLNVQCLELLINLKGQIPIGLLALKAGVTKDKKEIIIECIKMVRDKVGPVAAFQISSSC